MIMGYWNRPEATAEAITDGWFHTGDVARLDDDGFIYIVDRIKDMVIRGGENIYCVEVETMFDEHPAVAEAAVIGIPHEVLGEEVGAVVYLEPGETATEEELRAFVAEQLASFKVPARVWIRPEPLPVSAIGKILKQQLREDYVQAPTPSSKISGAGSQARTRVQSGGERPVQQLSGQDAMFVYMREQADPVPRRRLRDV